MKNLKKKQVKVEEAKVVEAKPTKASKVVEEVSHEEAHDFVLKMEQNIKLIRNETIEEHVEEEVEEVAKRN
nr:hypothetical protein [Entomoplasma sp. MP1]